MADTGVVPPHDLQGILGHASAVLPPSAGRPAPGQRLDGDYGSTSRGHVEALARTMSKHALTRANVGLAGFEPTTP